MYALMNRHFEWFHRQRQNIFVEIIVFRFMILIEIKNFLIDIQHISLVLFLNKYRRIFYLVNITEIDSL